MLTAVDEKPKTTEALVTLFLSHTSRRKHATTRQWLAAFQSPNIGPVELMDEISAALDSSADELPDAILRGIAFCLDREPNPHPRSGQRCL